MPITCGSATSIPDCLRVIHSHRFPRAAFALQDPEDAADKLIAVLREKKADVIVTYDENGGYPHPDHIMVHTITMIAWERMGDPGYKPELGEAYEPKKLYYTHGFIRQRVEKFHEEFLAQGKPSPLADYVERMRSRNFDLMRRVTTQVPCADYFENRDQALLSHATQIDPEGTFLRCPWRCKSACGRRRNLNLRRRE